MVAIAAILPICGVILATFQGEAADISTRDVLRYAATSLTVAICVGLCATGVGSLLAWIVVMHRFPGRDLFAWTLALPLAVPAFALAYAYTDLADVAGPARTWLRDAAGLDLPIQMRSVPGAVFVLTCCFYPYVYLAMRSHLMNQSVAALEAARTLGASGPTALWRVILPLARPALIAGAALVVMETLADYGALQFLAVQTLTTGVVRAWSVYGSTASAAQFALPLLGVALLLLWLERGSRGNRRFDGGGARWRDLPVKPLTGVGGAVAAGACGVVLLVALALPVGWLALMALDVQPEAGRVIHAALNTLALAGSATLVIVGLGFVLALGARSRPWLMHASSLGYVTPGAVMAIGLLVPAGWIWTATGGGSMGAISVALLLYAYASRMMAAALSPIDAGLQAVSPSMLQAARTLGRGEWWIAAQVQAPIARGALLTASLLVFVDVLKELPATLILRPFNFDTLAVMANNYALDERLAQAAWPALMLLGLSAPAMIWLTTRLDRARPGSMRP